MKALKLLSDHVLTRLLRLMNASRSLGVVPLCWKESSVVLIPKGDKDPGKLVNLRPISLLNTMEKLCESFVKRTIEEIAEEKGVWQAIQFGFRTRLSAMQQATNVVERMKTLHRPRYSEKKSIRMLFTRCPRSLTLTQCSAIA